MFVADKSPTDFPFLKSRAEKLLNKITPSHYSDALSEDMAMAGIEYAIRRSSEGHEIYYQDVRTAMLDEMFRWILNVTAHQSQKTMGKNGKGRSYLIKWEDWVSQFTRTSADGIERQVMARVCLKKIITGDIGKYKSKNRKENISKILNQPIDRTISNSLSHEVRLIKKEILTQLMP